VAVTLEVLVPPAGRWLHFWALQVSFVDGGRRTGGAHLGLQYAPAHPGATAVNWGGYRDGAGELAGTTSTMPSTPGNPNTRDYAWAAQRPYRLRIGPGVEPGTWRGEVTDVLSGETTGVRELWCPGTTLTSPVVWSEVFAPCDAPGTAVRWTDPSVTTVDGDVFVPTEMRVTYQSYDDGGCTNSATFADGAAVLQVTAAERRVPQGGRLRLSG
jgi:hypothetical protein